MLDEVNVSLMADAFISIDPGNLTIMQHNKDSDGQSAYDYTQEDDRMVEPSAEPRAPQLNGTICGCNCSQRGFVDGDSERDDQTRDKDGEKNLFHNRIGLTHDSHISRRPGRRGIAYAHRRSGPTRGP